MTLSVCMMPTFSTTKIPRWIVENNEGIFGTLSPHGIVAEPSSRGTVIRAKKEPVRKEERIEQTLQQAWVGDAVLCLYARLRILDEGGRIDSERFTRMTSNRFLGVLGEASEVEAEIGRIYRNEGLDAAFQWIDERLLPVFRKQEANRSKRDG